MSLPEETQDSAQSPFQAIDWAICALLLAVTVLWSAFAGKDLNWDQLNYHFYAGFSFLHDRLSHDFMAANGQSVINPLAYVPFSWMVSQQWPSLLVASILALMHSCNLIFIYAMLVLLIPERSTGAAFLRAIAVALAFESPIFLLEVGTSFADVSTSAFVLAGLWLVLRFYSLPGGRNLVHVLGAGLCVGAATGLKMSNAIFAPALALCLLAMGNRPTRTVRALAALAAGGVAGWILTHGYWSWVLLHTYGAPNSPSLASILSSPDLPAGTPLPNRFIPTSLKEALLLPFRMVQLRSWIYVENSAGDLRPAVFTLLLIFSCAIWILRKFVRNGASGEESVAMTRMRACQRAFLSFFLVAFILWVATSANGRYGMVVSLMCGPALVVLAHQSFRQHKVIVGAGIILFAFQAVHLYNGQLRWTDEPWTKSWYEVSMPERLASEPFLYVSVGGNSNSFLVPFFPPAAAYTNPVGQISFDLDSSAGTRLRRLFDKYADHVRIISEAPMHSNEAEVAGWIRSADTVIARFGFAVDPTDCDLIEAAGPSAKLGQDFSVTNGRGRTVLRTCRLVPRNYAFARERERITQIVRAMATWCPRLLTPTRAVVEQIPDGWYASFVSTDSTLIVHGEQVTLTQPRSAADVFLGTLSGWEQGYRFNCDALPEKFRQAYTFD